MACVQRSPYWADLASKHHPRALMLRGRFINAPVVQTAIDRTAPAAIASTTARPRSLQAALLRAFVALLEWKKRASKERALCLKSPILQMKGNRRTLLEI